MTGDKGATGDKGLTGDTGAKGVDGDNGTPTTIGVVGEATAKAATITNGVLSLSPADGSNPGIVTTVAQTFAGAKTFSSSVTTTGTLIAGDVTYPNAHGLSGEVLSTSGTGSLIWKNPNAIYSVEATTTGNPFDLDPAQSNYSSLNVLTTNNLRIGNDALKNITNGIGNIAIGDGTMYNTNTGTANVGVGYKSMYNNTTGKNNTAVGSYTLYDNTTGNYNSAFGNLALVSNTTGNSNSAFGEGALRFNTTGKNNIAIGTNALANNTVGENNTASGQAALKNNTTGFYNAAFGTQSLQGNTDGYFNTAIGFYAGRYIGNSTDLNTTSDYSVYLGSVSRASADDAQNEIVIGYNAIGAGSNTVQLGNTSITNVKTSGTITAGTVTYPNAHNTIAGQVLTVDALGTASWSPIPTIAFQQKIKANSIMTGNLSMTSDSRLKSEIKSLPSTFDLIKKLNPVSYKKKDSISSVKYNHEEMGFIAQEIQKVLPMLVIEGSDKDKTLSVNYISLIPVLTKAIQEQQTQIEEKGKQTDELKKQLDRQQKEINELRELIKSIKK